MATVFMKWLETRPSAYDRGIHLLTLGRLRPLLERIAREHIRVGGQPNVRVLEIGCGTGALSVLMAGQGAHVTAIDTSRKMLEEAVRKSGAAQLAGTVEFRLLDVTELTEHFEPASFDVVVSVLVFSELPPRVRRRALLEISRLLKPDGWLLVADEMVPNGILGRLVFVGVRVPLVGLTWLLTRTTTTPLRQFAQTLAEAGFVPVVVESHLGGSLQLIRAHPASVARPIGETCPRLRHQVTLRTVLLDLWCLIARIVPPYPKIDTGLYRIGDPDRTSPVLVTGNYDLTVRRLVRELDGKVDCWLVVADSHGINVWCGAGGGHFTAGQVADAVRSCRVGRAVDHRMLILPQLCANGVDGWRIRREIGWNIQWGPVRAADIPAYLEAGCRKTDEMRHVRFPLRDRLEMTAVMLVFYGGLFLVPSLALWRNRTPLLLGAMTAIGCFYGIFLPWVPGRDGLGKGAVLAGLTLAGLWTWSLVWGHLPAASLFYWALGLGFMAFFVGSEFQGMSPLMRGEQANWLIEALIGLATLAAYGAGRLVLGS